MKSAEKKLVIEALAREYADARPLLNYSSAFELLVAVVLSAQCTDERVNVVTPRLFPEYNTPEKFMQLTQMELEKLIRDAGLFKAKARNLLATAAILAERFDGVVPGNFEQLTALPGIGRKTANVILSVWFDIPALAVDTHVFRVANRSGLAFGKTPDEVENGLKKIIERERWSKAHHWLIWHGRRICKARKPDCAICLIVEWCDKLI